MEFVRPIGPNMGESGGCMPKTRAPMPHSLKQESRDRFKQTRGKRDDKKVRPTSM